MKNEKGVSLITLIITIIVVIILAVIVLRSGASDTPDQAAFSAFTQEMGELQDAVKLAMLTAKGEEQLKGNQRTEAQVYNFIARGGYEGFEDENKDVKEKWPEFEEIPLDNKWVVISDAEELQCTLINKRFAKNSIGMNLPKREVETYWGTNREMSYFVTPKGNVFCWPPYVYDGKSYVNADTTIKSDTIVDIVKDENGKWITKITNVGTKEFDIVEGKDTSNWYIHFGNDEVVIVANFVIPHDDPDKVPEEQQNTKNSISGGVSTDIIIYNDFTAKNRGDAFTASFNYYDNSK